MKRSAAAVLLLVSTTAAAQTFDLRGFIIGRGIHATGPLSWTRGGFGRFDETDKIIAEAQIGADWRPFQHLLVHAHGVARDRHSGLISAYVETDFERGGHEFQLRAGQLFLGTSRENTADLWSSPYTINDSVLNTWIAQEVRPIGVDAEWRVLTSTALITTGATAFRGNDTMGTLLAWRGWTIGNRLSVYDEVLPLPPLRSLQDVFVKQRRDGTVPFESDLDGRTSYAARIRYALPERFNVQYTHLDNRGDRQLYRGEYAWKTRFDVIGAQGQIGSTTLVAEWMKGQTGMGNALPARVDMKFDAAYALLSQKIARHRFTARVETFNTRYDYNEHGRAATLSWLFDITPKLRAGAEVTGVIGRHEEAEEHPQFDAHSAVLEIRYSLK